MGISSPWCDACACGGGTGTRGGDRWRGDRALWRLGLGGLGGLAGPARLAGSKKPAGLQGFFLSLLFSKVENNRKKEKRERKKVREMTLACG